MAAKVSSPCYKCLDRSSGCHSRCQAYGVYHEGRVERSHQRQFNAIVTDVSIQLMKNRKGPRRK